MNRLQLFLEIELALILEERAAHLVVELALEAEQLDLARQHLAERVEELREGRRLEQRLSRLDAHGEMRRDPVGLALDGFRALNDGNDLVRNSAVERDVLLEEREHSTRHARSGSPDHRARSAALRRARRAGSPEAGT